MTSPSSHWLSACALAAATLFGMPSQAAVIDDARAMRVADAPVVRLVFVAPVRVLPPLPRNAADVHQLRIELVGVVEAAQAGAAPEVRQLRAEAGVPDMTIVFAAAPSGRVHELTLQLRERRSVQVRPGSNARELDIVFSAADAGVSPAPSVAAPPAAAAPPAVAGAGRYALLLQTFAAGTPIEVPLIPRQFKDLEVVTVPSASGGPGAQDLLMGWFDSREQAESARQQAAARFPNASIVPAPTPATTAGAAAPGPAVPAAEKPDDAALAAMEQRAEALMGQARSALEAKRFEEALARLNELLLLPPNRQSQSAQALIGDAWAGAGDTRRARIEFELYLKLYPKGPDAPRIAGQLAALGGSVPRTDAAAEGGAATARARPRTGEPVYSGSIAQYYSGGKAKSKSLVNLPSGIDQTTLTTTNESALVTSVDLGARLETETAEYRGVVRGSGSANLSSTSHSDSLLSAAYVDYRHLASGLAVRLGRQSAISGGLLGMFDGVSLAWPIREGVKLDVMGGVPANTLVASPSQRLLAAMLELDGLVEKWGGNIYLVDQTSEGYTNRRALGAEVRYSDESWSGYALADYDVLFRSLNAASLQGSWQIGAQTTVTLLLDDRKAPALALNNALISQGQPSLAALFTANPGLTVVQARALAQATSARASQASLSVSRPINERWQLSGELRYSQIGALPAVGDFAATPATGAQVTGSLQLTGTNLYSSRDINNVNLAVMRTPFFKGAQLAFSNLTGMMNNDLTVEPSLRLYAQHSNDGMKVQRVSPGVRLSYRASRRVNLLGEAMVEHSSTDGPTSQGSTNAASFYLGYRYELF